MIDDVWSNLQRWEDTVIRDKDEAIPIRFGLAATLYFHNGHTESKRRASLECFNDYEKLCSEFLKWHRVGGDTSRMSSVAKLRNHDMSPYLLSSKWNEPEAYEHAWGFYWHGGNRSNDASAFKIHAYGSPEIYVKVRNAMSFLQVSFPVLFFQDKPERFIELILRWCELLQPYHGYGGIMLLNSPDRGLTQRYSPNIAAFASRYPGIEIDRPLSHEFETHDGIKGGNWLTILSTYFVDKLAENDSLYDKIKDPLIVKDYEGGVMIVAGSVPEVGDRNRNIDTPIYKQLARILKPIRIREHRKPYVKGRFGEEGEFAAWLARFDE